MSESPAFDVHGRIKCGTVAAPDFAASLADYTRELAMEVVEEGRIPPELARSWGVPACVARPYALLRGRGASPGFLRLVGCSPMPGYQPLRTHGWAAFEFTVRDAFALHGRIDQAAFAVLGPPKLVPGFDTFIPFQVRGRAGEVLYLNQVLRGQAGSVDLPFAAAEVDHMFIAVLAADDRAATVRFHVEALRFEEGETYVIPYSMINDSFGLPADVRTAMTMTRVGRLAGSEVDQYPDAATHRPRPPGELPPGNSMVTFIARSLDDVRAPFIEPPARRDGAMYAGRRAACLWGPSGELIELIEAA